MTGGRDFKDRDLLYRVLNEIAPTAIAHGGAVGADRLAGEWASAHNVPVTVYPARWKADMLRSFAPDLVVAFKGGEGTLNCKIAAMALGIRVRRC